MPGSDSFNSFPTLVRKKGWETLLPPSVNIWGLKGYERKNSVLFIENVTNFCKAGGGESAQLRSHHLIFQITSKKDSWATIEEIVLYRHEVLLPVGCLILCRIRMSPNHRLHLPHSMNSKNSCILPKHTQLWCIASCMCFLSTGLRYGCHGLITRLWAYIKRIATTEVKEKWMSLK